MKLLIITLIINIAFTAKCPLDQLCAACEGSNCKMCYQSFTNFGECVKPTKAIEHCLRYTKDGVCDFCFHGYTHNQDGSSCDRIGITDCMSVVDGVCTLCKRGILIENGKCGDKKCVSKNCAFCALDSETGLEICDQCDSGYASKLVEGTMTCVKEDETKHCYLLAENNSCTLCDVNYYSSNGKCVKSTEMDIKMITDQGFMDKIKDKITDLFDYVHTFSLISLSASLLMIFS